LLRSQAPDAVRLLRLALLLGSVGLAAVAESVTYEAGDLALVLADAVVGLVVGMFLALTISATRT